MYFYLHKNSQLNQLFLRIKVYCVSLFGKQLYSVTLTTEKFKAIQHLGSLKILMRLHL